MGSTLAAIRAGRNAATNTTRIACLVPARRAVRVEPMAALRHE